MMRSGIYFFFCLSLSSALVVHKRRIVETISVENGKLVRNVIDDGHFGSGDDWTDWTDWTDAEVFLENGWPTAINLSGLDLVEGLRVKYGDTWGEYHGKYNHGGNYSWNKSCDWGSDDDVIVVQGQIGIIGYITELELITANGHVCGPYGAGGYGESWISVHPGCNLEYLSGVNDFAWGDIIDGLSMHWVC